MDTMEINKIVASLVGALLIYLGVQFISEFIYHEAHHGEAHAAYTIEVEEDEVAEEETAEAVDIVALMAAADLGSGEKLFKKCAACHKAADGENGVGPYLYGVVGRDIASVDGFGYSGVLSELPGDWTPQELSAFLENPKGYAKGTKMVYKGMKKPEDRADLIAWLDSLDD